MTISRDDSDSQCFKVSSREAGMRVDRFLKERFPQVSRHRIQIWARENRVLRNGSPAQKGMILEPGDQLVLKAFIRKQDEHVLPDPSRSLNTLFEDPFLVAIAKPPGMPTHPLEPGEKGTAANALVARYPEMQGIGFSSREPGLLHRLDKDTSGVLLAARTAFAFEKLRGQFEEERVTKIYMALVHGRPDEHGVVKNPIGSRTRRSSRVEVVHGRETGRRMRSQRPAETHYRVIRSGETYSLVLLRMTTGARHQLRAHLSFLGHPVVGDRLYGPGRSNEPGEVMISRHLLHAAEIRFFHPDQGGNIRVRCPLPEDFRSFQQAHDLL